MTPPHQPSAPRAPGTGQGPGGEASAGDPLGKVPLGACWEGREVVKLSKIPLGAAGEPVRERAPHCHQRVQLSPVPDPSLPTSAVSTDGSLCGQRLQALGQQSREEMGLDQSRDLPGPGAKASTPHLAALVQADDFIYLFERESKQQGRGRGRARILSRLPAQHGARRGA